MATWDFDDIPKTPATEGAQDFMLHHFQDTKAAYNAARMLSLYDFLHSRPFSSPQEIQQAVIKEGRPLFTPEEAREAYDSLHPKDGMRGGAAADAIVDKLGSYTGIGPPKIMDPLFFVGDLEKNDSYGPFVGAALDVVTLGLPTLATGVTTLGPQIAGILPIPLASVAGSGIAWLISSAMLFFVMLVNLTRRKFGSAFVTALGIIPVFGTSIMNGANTVGRILERANERRARLVNAVKKTLGTGVGGIVDTVIPDLTENKPPEEVTPPPPPPAPADTAEPPK
jgi:hypothetical protein